ncbi:MAG TPA: transcriptional regulator [Rhodobacteraceae bacterium]|nr:transcriptional regulator [Paracoccaceae bacterium]
MPVSTTSPSTGQAPAKRVSGNTSDTGATAEPAPDPAPDCAIQSIGEVFKALSNEHRLRIMGWLMNPIESFPGETNCDLETEGVCVTALTAKTGLTQPSVTNHMHLLQQAGLVTSSRRRNWVFYKPQRERFHDVIDALKILASKAPDHH